MGHPCKIMGLSICIMSSVIALLSCQPLFRELKREKKKAKNPIPIFSCTFRWGPVRWFWPMKYTEKSAGMRKCTSTWDQEDRSHMLRMARQEDRSNLTPWRHVNWPYKPWVMYAYLSVRNVSSCVCKSLFISQDICSGEQKSFLSDGEHKGLTMTSCLFPKNFISVSLHGSRQYICEHWQNMGMWKQIRPDASRLLKYGTVLNI